MVVKQIYNIVNSANKQAFGENAIEVIDLQGVISTGNTVLSTATNKDLWFKAIADKITKTIISDKVYNPKVRSMVMDKITYGAAIEKIYIAPEDAIENVAWKVEEGTVLGPGKAHFADVKVKIFDNRDTWRYDITIPDYQIDSAFHNESTLAAFITGIYNAIETSMNAAIENLINLCYANLIGELLAYEDDHVGQGVHAVNLLKEYNTLTNAGLTADSARRNNEFYKYAGMRMKQIIDRMSKISVIYNTEGYHRFTDKEDMNVLIHTDFDAGYQTYLEADTFHNELVKLPGFETVSYWQGQGAKGDFADTSKINITTASGKTVAQGGIIGMVFDKKALGVMFDDMRTDTYVDKNHDVVQLYNKATKGFFVDTSENAVVFYIAEDNQDIVQVD